MKKVFVVMVAVVMLLVGIKSVFADDIKKNKNTEDIKKVSHIFSEKTDEDWAKIELSVLLESTKNELKYLEKDVGWKKATPEEIGIKKIQSILFCGEIEKCLSSFNKECYEPIIEITKRRIILLKLREK